MPKDLESHAVHQIHFQAAGSTYRRPTGCSCKYYQTVRKVEECQTRMTYSPGWTLSTHRWIGTIWIPTATLRCLGLMTRSSQLDIMKLEHLCQYTWDKILVPLNLWETKVESYDSGMGLADMAGIFKWRKDVEPGYVEDIEDIEDIEEVKVEEVEEVVEEEGGGSSLDIEEILSFDYAAVNMEQWEMEV
ncbi:hypothetical protein V8E53_002602 [Lactarius tabidus]